MFPNQMQAQMTGMPTGKKKTRRGKSRGKKPVGTPQDHHTALGAALTAGDHNLARKHAFSLIRSLPQSASNVGDENDASDTPQVEAAEGESGEAQQPKVPSAPTKTMNASRLLSALRAKRG